MIMRALTRARADDQAGYALLAALWLCLGISALGLSSASAALRAMWASSSRTTSLQAVWHARACMSAAEAAAHEAFERSRQAAERRMMDWIRLDQIVEVSSESIGLPCAVTARPVGSRLDVNTADRSVLFDVLVEGGTAPSRADSLVAALMDWIDPDTVAREFGAERPWYAQRLRPTPTDGPVGDLRALALVRGLSDGAPELAMLDVEAGVSSLNHAPVSILRTLPGVGADAAAAVERARRQRVALTSYQELDRWGASSSGPPPARSVWGVSLEPEAWILTTTGQGDRGGSAVVLEWRVSRVAGTLVLRRQRMWAQ
jgi:general secretion pathway protein K